ncbi:MAG: pyridoxal phosphate-dependent aminotransferase [Bryobacterales bacterium]|nr:pyridoxal phosphate-dependent aminotransferase [Bryobacterales bacterium]
MAAALRKSGAELLDLTESNPTRAGLDYPVDAILGAFRNPRMLEYHPTPAGSPEAREAVSRYYAERACRVAPEQVLLTASTSESYAFLFKVLASPGDEILVPRPSYPLFDFLARLESVRISYYPLAYHGGWWLDFDMLRDAITPRTRAILLVNPNNPTGSFIKRSELESLVSVAAERGIPLIGDEVFSDFAFDPDPARASSLADVREAPAFCLSGLSKVSALPQMKLGWIVVAGPPPFQRAAIERLELVADTYLSVSTPVHLALPGLLAAGEVMRPRILARIRANLAWLRSQVGMECPCQVLPVEGGWYAILRLPRTRGEEEWALELLELDSVLVQPGYFYDFDSEAFLVLSLLTPPDIFRRGVERILAHVAAG